MNHLIVSILISLYSFSALADWVCNDHDSKLIADGTMVICGESVNHTSIDEAKAWSFHQARLEFWRMCMASDTCRGYEVSIIPGRVECEVKTLDYTPYIGGKKRWSCKRSVTFTVDRSKPKCKDDGFHDCRMNQMPFDGV